MIKNYAKTWSFAGLVALMCLMPPACAANARTCTITINARDGATVTLTAEIADTDELRGNGLMFRKSLPEMRGMIFIFAAERSLQFWMKNTLIPLDIAYISSDGVINEILHMKPLDTSVTYPAQLPARYALEVSVGWFERHNIGPGARVQLNGCVGK